MTTLTDVNKTLLSTEETSRAIYDEIQLKITPHLQVLSSNFETLKENWLEGQQRNEKFLEINGTILEEINQTLTSGLKIDAENLKLLKGKQFDDLEEKRESKKLLKSIGGLLNSGVSGALAAGSFGRRNLGIAGGIAGGVAGAVAGVGGNLAMGGARLLTRGLVAGSSVAGRLLLGAAGGPVGIGIALASVGIPILYAFIKSQAFKDLKDWIKENLEEQEAKAIEESRKDYDINLISDKAAKDLGYLDAEDYGMKYLENTSLDEANKIKINAYDFEQSLKRQAESSGEVFDPSSIENAYILAQQNEELRLKLLAETREMEKRGEDWFEDSWLNTFFTWFGDNFGDDITSAYTKVADKTNEFVQSGIDSFNEQAKNFDEKAAKDWANDYMIKSGMGGYLLKNPNLTADEIKAITDAINEQNQAFKGGMYYNAPSLNDLRNMSSSQINNLMSGNTSTSDNSYREAMQ